jgi:predicted ATPase with chaperone activity
MDSKVINLGQAEYAKLPALALIIAARNLCSCGRLGDSTMQCICTPNQLRQFQRRLQEPLLDRFQLSCEMTMQDVNQKSELTAEKLLTSIA